jgi:uncharacterized repeat protein (TIGR01451 family)
LFSASVHAAVGGFYLITSNVGTVSGDAIFNYEVVVDYKTTGLKDKQATDNLDTEISVQEIFGFDPRVEQVPTAGIDPDVGEAGKFYYDFRNVGNDNTTFTVSWNMIANNPAVASLPSHWAIAVNTENLTIPYRGSSGAIVLTVSGNPGVLPGDYAVVTFSITCDDDPNANAYQGDNAATYGGYGYWEQTTTTTILVARIAMTKNVVVMAPTLNGYTYGNQDDAVPGAMLLYTISWENVGSIKAEDILFSDDLPDTYTNLSGNVVTAGIGSGPGTVSYNYKGTYQLTSTADALDFTVGYDEIAVDATGNITYRVIIK